MFSTLCQKICLLGSGISVLLIGGLVSAAWPFIFNQQLQNQLVLSNDSRSYNLWKDTPIPMYLDIYMFNWTNPEEYLNKGEKPIFNEIGPYVFKEERHKVILGWNDNGTVTFKQIRKWVFVPELSNGRLSDEITNVNVIAMTIGNLVKKTVPKYFYPLINEAIKLENKIYITKPVRQLLFEGYNDVFLEILKDLKAILKVSLPMDKFGWFYNRNMSATYDGVFNMMTGEGRLQSLGILKEWNYGKQTKYFNGACGTVSGTTGELWPVDISSRSTATVFSSDLCSKIDLAWSGSKEILGASGVLFTGQSSTLDNSTTCYCVNHFCHPSGVREISTCRYSAPAFISFPHFNLADPYFRTLVQGMEPDPEKHRFDITVHKMTGVPLSVNARLQINILVDKIPGLKFYEKLRKAYMPTLWFNERALITPQLASELSQLEVFSWLEPAFLGVTGLGLVLFFIGLYCWSTGRWKRGVESPLLDNTSVSS